MSVINYKFLKVFNGICNAAICELSISEINTKAHIFSSNLEIIPFRSQGYLEGGYEVWRKSAVKAITCFFDYNETSAFYNIELLKLEGRPFLDTNNATVGICCILCIAEYLEINIEDATLAKMYLLIDNFWKEEQENIPDFSVIFEA